jgi:GTP-binding protein YchF
LLNSLGLTKEEIKSIKSLGLLTLKPCIYVANVDENSIQNGNDLSKKLEAKISPSKTIRLSSKLELDISKLALEEKNEMKDLFNIKISATDQLIKTGYDLLNMITYFTTGPKETRGWSIEKGFKAPQAAGVIHTDFERGFIKAECISYDDFTKLGGEAAAKESGKLRLEGKDYVVKDADIMHFKFNV